MKATLILALAAGLAIAHPSIKRQAGDKKLPFFNPAVNDPTCRAPQAADVFDDKAEHCVGTVDYCDKEFYKHFEDGPYKDAAECKAARADPSTAGGNFGGKLPTPTTSTTVSGPTDIVAPVPDDEDGECEADEAVEDATPEDVVPSPETPNTPKPPTNGDDAGSVSAPGKF